MSEKETFANAVLTFVNSAKEDLDRQTKSTNNDARRSEVILRTVNLGWNMEEKKRDD